MGQAACEHLGWETIPVTVIDLDNPIGAELDENDKRKNFDPSERVAIARAIDAHVRAKAKERMREGGKKGKPGVKGQENSLTLSPIAPQARDLIAAKLG